LEQIESKIQDKENIDTQKSNSQSDQITKLEIIIKEKLESIERKCVDVINTSNKDEEHGKHFQNLQYKAPDASNNVLTLNGRTTQENKMETDNHFSSHHDEPPIIHNQNNQYYGNTQLWIVGTSVVKDLRKSLMYRSRNVIITTLRDKTVRGAQEFLDSGKLFAENILYQVGSNDLDEKEPTQVAEEIERLIINTKKMFSEKPNNY